MSVRRWQGAILLAGAGVFFLVFVVGGAGFHWTPLVIGLVYLAAAFAGGPRGSYWSTAVVLSVFGLGPVARFSAHVDLSVASIYVIVLGLAVLLAAALADRGVAITPIAVGGTILALGIVFSLQTHLAVIEEPWLYVAFLALVGLVRVARPEPV